MSDEETPDIRGTMEAAYDKAQETESGDEAPAQPTSQEAAGPTVMDTQATEPVPPEYWSDEAKQQFTALSPELKALVLKTSQTQQADYTKKTQELAQQRKALESNGLSQATRKWDQYIRSLGATPEQAFELLIQAEYTLRNGSPEQKLQALQKLAGDYGIALPEGKGGEQNPQIAELMRTVQTLQQRQHSQDTQAQQELMRETQSQVDAFMNAKDESGAPKYPYFNDVREMMGTLFDKGLATTLDGAYDMATKWSPEVTQKMAADAKAKADQEAAARAKKARTAQSPKASAPALNGTGEKRDPRAIMEEAYDRIHGSA